MLAASRKEFSGSSLRIRRGSVLKGGELGDSQESQEIQFQEDGIQLKPGHLTLKSYRSKIGELKLLKADPFLNSFRRDTCRSHVVLIASGRNT